MIRFVHLRAEEEAKIDAKLAELQQKTGEVADIEGVDPSTVDMDYFMTSDTDTQILDQYLDDLSKRSGGLYVVGMHDCIEVCNVGLNKIGIGRGAEAGDIPRTMIWFYSAFANATYSGETGEETKRKGSTRCQQHDQILHKWYESGRHMQVTGRPVMASLVLSILLWFGCTHPNRPAIVANNAKWVPSAKTGYWQACSVSESQENKVSCTVWNEKGTVLVSERYLPLDGGTIPLRDQLSIADGPCKGPYEVCLENGRVLAPASIFEREKALFQRKP